VAALSILLALVALVIGFVGSNYLTQATLGVGIIAFACLVGIFARIVQAAAYHRAAQPATENAPTVAADGSTNG
jgi:hypothetical protein